MRLLFIDETMPELLRDAEFPAGGWAVQLKILLLALKARGHHAGVLTWHGANAYVGEQSVCELIEAFDSRTGPMRGIPKVRFLTHRIPSVVRAARAFCPDIIFQSCSGIDTATMALTAHRLDVPFVHRVAVDSDVDQRCSDYLNPLERWLYDRSLDRADLIICQNEYQHGQLRRRYRDKQLMKLPNAIDTLPVYSELPPRSQRRFVAWLATFRWQKNLPLLKRVASRLPSIPFHVGGRLPPKADAESTSAVEELKGLANVRLVGHVRRADVADFLSHAVLLLSTSRYEGFSNAFLEAFVAGTPVVAPAGVDPNGMISCQNLGRAAVDEDALVQGIREIWEIDNAAYGDFSNHCRECVGQHHSVDIVTEDLIAGLASLVAAFSRRYDEKEC